MKPKKLLSGRLGEAPQLPEESRIYVFSVILFFFGVIGCFGFPEVFWFFEISQVFLFPSFFK